MSEGPQIPILAGPNGAGKSTAAAFPVPEGAAFVSAATGSDVKMDGSPAEACP